MSKRNKSVVSIAAPPLEADRGDELAAPAIARATTAPRPLSIAPGDVQSEVTGVGMEIDGVEARLIQWTSDASRAIGESVSYITPDPAIAPAVLAPRFAGEPVRTDLVWPPQPRGTGEVWPPEARVEANQMSGRFPLAYAWPMLSLGKTWAWKQGKRTAEVTPAGAIAQVAATLLGIRPARPGDGDRYINSEAKSRTEQDSTVLITPNHLDEAAGQALLDAADAAGVTLHLLPRPMAAAMAWCRKHHDELLADFRENDQSLGTVLAMHFGLEDWEVTMVEIVGRRVGKEVRFLPVRRRPIEPSLPSYGIELMHRLAMRSLEMSYQQMGPSRVWELVWCTPWMKAALGLLADQTTGWPPQVALAKHARGAEFLKQQCRQATQRIYRTGDPVPALLRDCLAKPPAFTDIRDWFAARKKLAPPVGFLGAVITGPLAGVPHERQTVGQHHLEKIWADPKRVLIEGSTLPQGSLALMAAQHAAYLAQVAAGQVGRIHATYLEPLPRVRIAGTAQGQPTWVDLIDQSHAQVAGGVPVRRMEPLSGFPIKPDTIHFKIAVHHEDWPTVRIATARLPQVLSQTEPVTLHATFTPSHGYPRIELVPQHEGLFGRQRVLVDFKDAKDTGKSPEEFLHAVGQ
ncbi:MAG: hypothetical protein WD768_21285 [Phycisphaeraceae bacterium]